MNQTAKSFLALAALLSAVNIGASTTTQFTIRSQSVNAAREMVGWQDMINLWDMDCIYGSFNITPEYTQSFRSSRIAQCLFGNDIQCQDDCGSSILIQGSQISGRDPKAWLADYFGLPTNYNGTVSFRPRIRNFLVDLNFYLGLDELACGLYFRVHAPVVWTNWNLRVSENSTKGNFDHPVGYFAPGVVTNANLLGSALDFFSGKSVPTLPNGVIFDALSCSKWSTECGCEDNTKTRLSDIEFAFGWNFWRTEDYLLGVQIRASAPTGNKQNGCFLFEPVVGSGGHWKLGGALHFQGIFWRSCDNDSTFGFYLDANVQHMFEACQKRCFDLCLTCTPTTCNSDNSRYMLAQRLQALPTTGNRLTTTSNQGLVFANEFAPVANLTTFNVDVKIAVEGDVAAKFAYTNCNFDWDLGYNFWGRSCEKFCPKSTCLTNALDGKSWALKGDAQVYGFDATTSSAVALAATESKADIHSGTNNFAVVSTNALLSSQIRKNLHIDSPVPARNALTTDPVDTNAVAGVVQLTSNPLVALTQANVNFGGTRGISHKLFTHLNYEWRDNEDWTPYVGLGGEVEFGGGCGNDCDDCNNNCNSNCNPCSTNKNCNPCNTSTTSTTSTTNNNCCNNNNDCNDCCDVNGSCKRCALNQWGIWLKGGVSFN